MTSTILVVDDEVDLLFGLKRSIEMEIDCRVLTATDGEEALKILPREPVDLVLTDICMRGMDGIALLRAIVEIDASITVVMMTAYGTIELAVEAIKAGAYDFIRKPFEEDRLLHLLAKGLERNRLVRENTRLMKRVCEMAPLEGMVGKSRPMIGVFNTIRMLARSDVTVLILGETGTGKDLAAQAIHAASRRLPKPMVTVNCPALPESILESELFGYRRGAFTNATENKPGLFDQAVGSSIFLDEIGDLSLTVQTKLLRVLQDKRIKPLGDNKSHRVDVRIIAATNQDLHRRIEEGRFRPDLFYRLNVASLTMPPLRDIREDIPLLVEHFLKKAACEQNVAPKKIAPEVMDHLLSRDWPGNGRELENTLQGWTAVTPGDLIGPRQIQMARPDPQGSWADVDFSNPYKDLKGKAIETFTLRYLERLLAHTAGNVSRSAQISGIKRQSLQKIIKRYQISVENFRQPDE